MAHTRTLIAVLRSLLAAPLHPTPDSDRGSESLDKVLWAVGVAAIAALAVAAVTAAVAAAAGALG